MMKTIAAALLLLTMATAGAVPCDEYHAAAHTAALAALADNNCASVTECPEGSECAEAVETLADLYERCSFAEDEAYHALEEAESPCMVHAAHDVHADVIPCDDHEAAHDAALAALADNNCVSLTVCPEHSECAEAVETLADLYERCSVEEDTAFHALEEAESPCMVHAAHDVHADEAHDDHDHAATIPCEGAAGHEDAHTSTLTKLEANHCHHAADHPTCPEGSPCAEVVEALANYYTRCSIDHDAEDAVFQQMETDDGACMVHATHGVPCDDHEAAHDAALAALADNNCASVDECPEHSECAEAVETLADLYERCSVAEDEAFHTLEEAESPCMVHAAHDVHADEKKTKKRKPWGTALGAAVIVNIVTLAGIALLVPVVAKAVEAWPHHFEVVGNSFAGGCLLATAVFFLLYESNHLIPINSKQPESQAAALWGCMVLLGFLVSSIVDLGAHGVRIIRASHVEHCAACEEPKHDHCTVCDTDTDKHATKDLEATKAQDLESVQGSVCVGQSVRQFHILSSILVGDWLHNFVDGIFIGTAFVTCGASMGWSVTAATAFHELSQEISDYIVLTTQAKLTPFKALALNFLSGTSVIVGVVVVLAVDAIEGQVTGMLLAFGGGVYLQIGGVECMGKMHLKCTTLELRAASLLAFAIGAIAIGLVLLDHTHCEATDLMGGDDGHGHK